MRQFDQSSKKVNWVLISEDGSVADKGVAVVRTTKYGYETKFEKDVECFAGDLLVVDWEFPI